LPGNEEDLKSGRKFLFPLSVAIVFLLGFESGGFQSALIHIAGTFELNHTMAGFVVAVHYAALSVMPLIFGRISDRVGKKPILILFSLVLMLGCLVSIFSETSGVFILGIAMIGAGYGVSECLFTAAVSDRDPPNAEKRINLMQAAFCFGAFISPMAISYLMDGGATWRIAFILIGAGAAVLFPILLLTRFPAVRKSSKAVSVKLGDLFTSKVLLLLLLLIIAYSGLECGIAYFTVSYMTIELGSQTFGVYSLSCFWLAMMVSRLIFSRINISSLRIVYILYAFISAALFTLALSHNNILALSLFTTAGFLIGPIWPIIIATGTKTFPNYSGTVASILMAGGGGGASLFPYLFGLFANTLGFRFSFGFLALISLLAAVLWLGNKKH
jgi:fucose permease